MNGLQHVWAHWWVRAGAALLLFVMAVATLVGGFLHSSVQVASVSARLTTLQVRLRSTSPIEPGNIRSALPILNSARDLARIEAGEAPFIDWTMRMSQAKRLEAAAQHTYRRLLTEGLWPVLAARTEELLGRGDAPAALQYETLKAYLMLFDSSHFDALFLGPMFDSIVRLGQPTAEEVTDFGNHLDTLLAGGSPMMLTKNRALVEKVRQRLMAITLPQRVFERLKLQGSAGLAPFSISTVVGPLASVIFARKSGVSLDEGVPGLFTRDGYKRASQHDIPSVTRQLIEEESWVLGLTRGERPDSVVEEEVRRIYLVEYARVWKDYLSDVSLVPTDDLPTLANLVSRLASPDVLPLLVRAIARETTLVDVYQVSSAASASTRAADLVAIRPPTSKRMENVVDDQFVSLRRFLSTPEGGSKSPLDDTVAQLGALHSYLSAVQASSVNQSKFPPAAVSNRIKSESARLPDPLRGIFDDLAARGEHLADSPLEALKR